MATELAADLLAALAGTLVVAIWTGASWSRISDGLRVFPGLRWYLAAIGLAVRSFGLALPTVNGLVGALGVEEVQYSTPYFEAGLGWWAVVLSICVQPAISEELAFRGVIRGGLRGVLTDRAAIIVSALMFMILHLSILSLPHLLIMGRVLAILRVRTGSRYPGMVLHFSHDALCVGLEAWELGAAAW